MSKQFNNSIQIFNISNASHISVARNFKIKYNPYSREIKFTIYIVDKLKETLIDFIDKHQNEISYRTFINVDGDGETLPMTFNGCCLTNIRVTYGDLSFFIGFITRCHPENKEIIQKFIDVMSLRCNDKKQIVDIIKKAIHKKN